MLKQIRFIDYLLCPQLPASLGAGDNANYAYSPPDKEAVINLDEIVSVVPIARENTRRSFDDVVHIRFRDGSTLDAIGKPADFLIQNSEPTHGETVALAATQ